MNSLTRAQISQIGYMNLMQQMSTPFNGSFGGMLGGMLGGFQDPRMHAQGLGSFAQQGMQNVWGQAIDPCGCGHPLRCKSSC